MHYPNYIPVQFCRFSVAILVTTVLMAGCSESADRVPDDALTSINSGVSNVSNDNNGSNNAPNISEADDASNASEADLLSDMPGNDATNVVLNEPAASDPVEADPLVQNTISVNFDITVPVYQSNELSIELAWGDMNLAAVWVGDEYWTASGELPTDTEQLLVVTFYDRNGDIALAKFSEEFRTGSNVTEFFQILADQFNANQFDEDGDGVSNLDELSSGTDPKLDEDSLLEIRDFFALSSISTSRMSVSSSFEGQLSEDRPYFDTYERLPVPDGYPGTDFSSIDIDTEGNGTRTYSVSLQGTTLKLAGTRTNSGSAITWEGTRSAYDGDYGHNVSFTNTVTVVDENTRSFVEEIAGSNGGTYQFGWDISSNLTGHLIEETSFCEPVAGIVSFEYRENYWDNAGLTTTSTTVSKEIEDQYWRVVSVRANDEISEMTEYFVRELVIHRPYISASAEIAPEFKYFICDFVDI